jgi:hypothetical protein
MPQAIDDFTIVLTELTDMAACELKVYDGLDRLWRMVERYKMTAPIAIRVVGDKADPFGHFGASVPCRYRIGPPDSPIFCNWKQQFHNSVS